MRGFYPGAFVKNIPPGDNDPPIMPRVAILHVDAGNALSLFDFFRLRSGGVESHFHITRNGVVEQYRSIYFQADANLKANDFAVSIETQGFGDGEWTPAQLQAIKGLLLWLNREAGIPLRKIQRWDGSGVGYHTLFGSPSEWTPVAKSCPGPLRIRQFEMVLVPWMNAGHLIPPPKPTPVKLTRGKRVDAAIKNVRAAIAESDSPTRLGRLRAGLKALRSIDRKAAK